MYNREVLIKNLINFEGKSVKSLMYKTRKNIADKIKIIRNEEDNCLRKQLFQELSPEYYSLNLKTDYEIKNALKSTIVLPLEEFNKIIFCEKGFGTDKIQELDLQYYQDLSNKFNFDNLECVLKYNSNLILGNVLSFFKENFSGLGEEYVSWRDKLNFEKFHFRNHFGYKISSLFEKGLLDFDNQYDFILKSDKLPLVLDGVLKFRERKGKTSFDLVPVIERFNIFPNMGSFGNKNATTNLTNYIFKSGGKMKCDLIDKINYDFDSKFISNISNWVDARNTCDFISEKFEDYLKTDFGLDLKIGDFFDNSRYLRVDANQVIENNLFSMYALESQKTGSVKHLFEKYGILSFFRYPTKILLNQLENENKDSPYGALVFAKDDNNGALENVFCNFSELKNSGFVYNHQVRIFECEDKKSLCDKFKMFDDQYGNKNKISFSVWNIHGNKFKLALGKDGFIFKDDFKETFFSELPSYFVDNSPLIFNSCFIGIEGGIAQEFSKLGFNNVLAPDGCTSIGEISVEKSQNGLELNVKYPDSSTKIYGDGKLLKTY